MLDHHYLTMKKLISIHKIWPIERKLIQKCTDFGFKLRDSIKALKFWFEKTEISAELTLSCHINIRIRRHRLVIKFSHRKIIEKQRIPANDQKWLVTKFRFFDSELDRPNGSETILIWVTSIIKNFHLKVLWFSTLKNFTLENFSCDFRWKAKNEGELERGRVVIFWPQARSAFGQNRLIRTR